MAPRSHWFSQSAHSVKTATVCVRACVTSLSPYRANVFYDCKIQCCVIKVRNRNTEKASLISSSAQVQCYKRVQINQISTREPTSPLAPPPPVQSSHTLTHTYICKYFIIPVFLVRLQMWKNIASFSSPPFRRSIIFHILCNRLSKTWSPVFKWMSLRKIEK